MLLPKPPFLGPVSASAFFNNSRASLCRSMGHEAAGGSGSSSGKEAAVGSGSSSGTVVGRNGDMKNIFCDGLLLACFQEQYSRITN